MAGYSVTYTVVDNATKTINDINKKIQNLRAPMEQQAKAMSKFLDVSGLQKVGDGFSVVARTSADAFSSMARLVPVMGTLTGAATLAGLASLIKGFTDLGTQLERNADYLGTSTGTLNQWQNAVTLAGGSVENLNEGMKELAKTGYDAALGRNAVAMQRFTRAGITANDLMHKSATELMPQVLDYINQFTDARDRETVATQLGGRALYELSEDFRLSGKTYAEWMEAAKKYGAVLDPERLRKYRQNVGELSVAFRGLGTEVTDVMATALTPFIKDFATWVHENQPQIIAAVKQIAEVFKDLAEVLKTILGYAADVATRLSGMPTAEDILNESPLAKNLTDEQKRAILAAHPNAHATPQMFTGVGPFKGESAGEREDRIRRELGAPGSKPTGVEPNAPYGTGTIPPAGTPPPAPGTVPPTGTTPPQSSAAPGTPAASLADERQRFAQELRDNPALREKLINIAATEQSNPEGNQAVIETMMNRAAAQGTSLAAQVRRTSEGGYYAGSDNAAAVAANRKMIEANLDKVLGGSNISNFATDNASNQPGNPLAAKRINNNEMQLRYQAGGEYFFSPSNPNVSGPGVLQKYRDWLARHPNTPPPAAPGSAGYVAPAGTSSAASTPTTATAANGRTIRVNTTQTAASKEIESLFQNPNAQHSPFLPKSVVGSLPANTTGYTGIDDPRTPDWVKKRAAELDAAKASGPPVSVAGAGKPANGSVDVTVTHKNAPPGTSVSGTAEGAGVNLIGPRIEQQQLSAA